MQPKLLIVETDTAICAQLHRVCAQDWEMVLVDDYAIALEVFRQERPALVILALDLLPSPQGLQEGLDILYELLHADDGARVIVTTTEADSAYAMQAIGLGAYDVFPKPLPLDELGVIVRRVRRVYDLEQMFRASQRQVNHEAFEEMHGESPQMHEVFTSIRRVAPSEVSVLIMGESGTGKEMVARPIHRQSARGQGPFITINCGSIPENLLESELFGHEKGAFTGAHTRRKGRIELAHKGALFLDEVGDLSLPLQVKLLRFLQEHQLERLAGRTTVRVNTRVLAATNVDLERAIADGRFREDLYYRLGVVCITLPPLRDRGHDIVLLARALLQRVTAERSEKIIGFNQRALLALQTYDWPGNVRELENRIKRAVIMASGPRLTPEDLDLPWPEPTGRSRTLKDMREAVEKDRVLQALARNQGNITRTAAELRVSRPTLHGLMAKYAIERS